ncbi:MAG: signal peptidase I [Anaerolineae bacterium]|nr:signal peptidase I [Anaerolineae bacterium]
MMALREMVETILPAVLIALVIQLFLAQATRVYGQSMEPNLHTSQRLVVEKISYRFHSPRRGDIVVIHVPGYREPLIKRVIALPGETLEIRKGVVYINGQPLDEPYVVYRSQESFGPIVIPPLHVFVMGDNRAASNDSRAFGPVHIDNVIGRAWLSYWPPALVGWVE